MNNRNTVCMLFGFIVLLSSVNAFASAHIEFTYDVPDGLTVDHYVLYLDGVEVVTLTNSPADPDIVLVNRGLYTLTAVHNDASITPHSPSYRWVVFLGAWFRLTNKPTKVDSGTQTGARIR